MTKISWCFSIKGGLEKTEPNDNLSSSYLTQAETSLAKVKELIEDNDLVWASVRIYYSAYYALYSFLQKIGVKSENHECSIELSKELLNQNFVDKINDFKKERIDSQYYLIIGKKEKLLELYSSAKEFYLKFKNIIDNISKQDIENFRSEIDKLARK